MESDEDSSPQSNVCDSCFRNLDNCKLLKPTCSSCDARGGQRAVTKARMAVLNDAWESKPAEKDALPPLEIQPEEVDLIIRHFLDILHESVPIFPKERFLADIIGCVYSYDLVETLVLITAKLTDFQFESADFDLDSRINRMLSSALLEQETCKAPPSIDQFRRDCLLVFYESHQFLGNQAWIRLGGLVRLASWKGLDRLDEAQTDQTRARPWSGAGQDDLEDWRLVWWFIYRLDTQVNLSLGTAYLIDEKNVKTSLLGPDLVPDPVLPGFTNDEYEGPEGTMRSRLYLPCHPNDHWKLVPEITHGPPTTMIPNLDILLSTVMRQFGRAFRLHMMTEFGVDKPPIRSITDAEVFLMALEISLPQHVYLDPTPSTSPAESPSDRRGRLVTLLQFHMCQLLTNIMRCSSSPKYADEDWHENWRQVGEACQNIASAAGHLGSLSSLAVDPRIAPIIFTALIFVHLHRKCKNLIPGSDLYNTLWDSEAHLVHLLKRLATARRLPRLLLDSYEKFKSWCYRTILRRKHIRFIIPNFESLLHTKWLNFLSSPSPKQVERIVLREY